jgi:hypothetical protein
MLEFLQGNWMQLLAGVIALAEVVVRLTPSEKDNSVLKKILNILFFFIPNLKKNGGTHE